MNRLNELYAAVMDAIYDNSTLAEGYIAADKTLSPAAQLKIYQGSVRGGLIQALGDLFPATKGLLGTRFFDAMALRYVALHPSRSASLDHYGASFPSFVKEFEHLRELPYISDLAALEWDWHRAFHAKKTDAIGLDQLGSVPLDQADQLCCELVEPLFLLRSDYPLLELRQLGLSKESDSDAVDISMGGGCYVVYRNGLDTEVTPISLPLFELLEQLKKMLSFGTICEQWLSKHPDLELNVYTSELIQRSWIAGFRSINY